MPCQPHLLFHLPDLFYLAIHLYYWPSIDWLVASSISFPLLFSSPLTFTFLFHMSPCSLSNNPPFRLLYLCLHTKFCQLLVSTFHTARNRQPATLTTTLIPGGWKKLCGGRKAQRKERTTPAPKALHVITALKSEGQRSSVQPVSCCTYPIPKGKQRAAAWHLKTWRIMHEHSTMQNWAWLVCFQSKLCLAWGWGETFGHCKHHRQPARNTTSGEYLDGAADSHTASEDSPICLERPCCSGRLVVNEITRNLYRTRSPVCTPDTPAHAGASSDAMQCVSTHCTKAYAFAVPFTLLFPIFSPHLTPPLPFF